MTRFKLDRNLIVFDLETSGTDLETSSVIQIGACKFYSNGIFSPRENFNIYIKPYASGWTNESESVHKLTPEFLDENGVTLKKALKRFTAWAGENRNHFYLAHWGTTFDMNMLTNAFRVADYKFFFSRRSYDIASIVRFYLAMNEHKLSSLFKCAEKLKIDVSNLTSHNAKDDAIVTGMCLEKVVEDVLGKENNKFK